MKAKAWRKLLKRHSEWIQGVYLRLHTPQELPADDPYKCHLLLAVPLSQFELPEWPETREAIEQAFLAFWRQLRPGIQCLEVEVLPTNLITLADIELYLRFDADWVSFEDETAVTPIAADFRA